MTPAPTASASAERGHPRALFFGDSYFVGGGCSPDAKQDMAYLAGTELGYRTTVRGAGGTGFVAANPEYDLPPYLGQIRDGALDVREPGARRDRGRLQRRGAAGRPGEEERPEDPPTSRANKYPRALLVLVGPLDPYGGYADSIPIRDALHAVAKQARRAVHRRHDLARRPPRVAVRRLRPPDVRRPGAARRSGSRRRSASAAPDPSHLGLRPPTVTVWHAWSERWPRSPRRRSSSPSWAVPRAGAARRRRARSARPAPPGRRPPRPRPR